MYLPNNYVLMLYKAVYASKGPGRQLAKATVQYLQCFPNSGLHMISNPFQNKSGK